MRAPGRARLPPLAVAALVFSCSHSEQGIVRKAVGEPGPGRAVSPRADPAAPRPATPPVPFFALASPSAFAGPPAALASHPAGVAARTEEEEAAAGQAAAPALATPRPEAFQALAGELRERLRERWQSLAGEAHPASRPAEAIEEAWRIALALAALSFLETPSGVHGGRGPPPGVIETLESVPEDAVDARLLLAAFLGLEGQVAERERIVAEVHETLFPPPASRPHGGSRDDDAHLSGAGLAAASDVPAAAGPGASPRGERPPGERAARFRLARLALAGPREATRPEAPDGGVPCFRPGDILEIRGELTGFEECELAGESGGVVESRFRAVLRLVAGDRRLLDTFEFLPARRGVQRVPPHGGPASFWVRYGLPADLPPGSYLLEVLAEDLLGAQLASALLEVAVE